MITKIAEHWLRPDKFEEGKAVFAAWSKGCRASPGCVFRQVIQSEKDPMKVTTITTWESHEDSERWHDSVDHAKITWYHHERLEGTWPKGEQYLWHTVKSEEYEVIPD